MNLTRLFVVLGLLAPLPLALAQTPNPLGAKEAIASPPVQYRGEVLKVSADNGTPNPPQWFILARNSGQDIQIFNIAVAKGQVISEKISLDLREMFKGPSAINQEKLVVDSSDAFAIAARYGTANGKSVSSVSYALEQKGAGSSPIWSVWCYGPDGRYIGWLQLLATDGSVVSSDGLPKAPAPL